MLYNAIWRVNREQEASLRGIEGLNVAITGGAGDIGAAMGAELCGLGASVTLIDRKTLREAEPWVRRVGELGERVRYVEADVREAAAIHRTLADIDPLDVAIGNAGIVDSAPFLEITEEQWRNHLDVNLTGCFNVGRAAGRLMVERNRPGRILFTGSWVGEVPWPEISAYSVSKAGVRMLARSMALELAPYRIRVNVIAPGIVKAGLAKRQMETEPQYARRVRSAIPLGEPQTPEQVAKATAFLCSDAADYMTGSVLLVDGGCSLFNFEDV